MKGKYLLGSLFMALLGGFNSIIRIYKNTGQEFGCYIERQFKGSSS